MTVVFVGAGFLCLVGMTVRFSGHDHGLFGRGLLEQGHGFSPTGAEVLPGGVVGDDEADLLDARPVFQLLFASDRTGDAWETLEIDELVDLVTRGEAFRKAPFLCWEMRSSMVEVTPM